MMNDEFFNNKYFDYKRKIMIKKFNVTGLCLPEQHYMADVSKKLAATMVMVEEGDYFIINRPRQYGKTTTLNTLAATLRKTDKYVVIEMSFEGVSDNMFKDEAGFSSRFIKSLIKCAARQTSDLGKWLKKSTVKVNDMEALSDFLTNMVSQTEKKVVLIIDEVDQSSNNQLFVSFLAMLRNKYLDRFKDPTIHSVVLAGVHDVKSLKLKLRPNEEEKYNSPWNIAADFKVDMNLQPSEIVPMLEEYARNERVKMNAKAIAEQLFYYTSGYPFLVSKLCKMLDEGGENFVKKNKKWTATDLDAAARELIQDTNTNFETLSKNIENSPELYQLIYQVAIDGEQVLYNPIEPIINFALLYGILVKKNNHLVIHNRIYQEVLVNYMTLKMHRNQLLEGVDFGYGYKNPDKSLNMELVLTKFQLFMQEQYSTKDRTFLERSGRLVFLAFIKPIINGSGYDFKEPQISEERRLDVVITYLQHRYLAELKIWRGEVAHEEGLGQLIDYLNRLNLTEGYLVIFDPRKTQSWKKEWVTVEGKRVFTIWI